MFWKPRSKFGRFLDERGINQRWLAKQTNITEGTISDLANGKRQPTLQTANKIVKELRKFDSKISAEDFWG